MGISPGDPVVPDSPFTVLNGTDNYVAKAWDSRAGCALVHCWKHLVLNGVAGGCPQRFTRASARIQFFARFSTGKSLKCATEEFADFLIQLLGGDEKRTRVHSPWS
jgi:hypothetical protein